MVDSLTLFFIIFTILGLIVVVLMLFHSYIKTHNKLLTLTRQNQYLKNQGIAESEKFLEDAHREALIIIDQASKNAGEILTQVKSIDTQNQALLKQKIDEAANLHAEELKKTSAALLALYKEALQNIQKNDINTASSITKDIEKGAQEEISKFKDSLSKQTVESEKAVAGKVQAEYQEIEEELKTYKAQKLKEVDSEILQIIQTVTENILKKQLSVDDQRELVLESLLEAKKQATI